MQKIKKNPSLIENNQLVKSLDECSIPKFDSQEKNRHEGKTNKGRLFLVPAPLYKEAQQWLINEEIDQIKHLKHFVVEHPKTSREFLKRIPMQNPIQEIQMYWLHHNAIKEAVDNALEVLERGEDVGLMSEAGCPAVADPGAQLVSLCQKKNIDIYPLIGPSSIILGLMSSGANGQSFSFIGYLEKEKNKKVQQIKQLQTLAQKGITQIFIETPYNNDKLLEELCTQLNDQTLLFLGINLSHPNAVAQTKTIGSWNKRIKEGFLIGKLPTIWILVAQAKT